MIKFLVDRRSAKVWAMALGIASLGATFGHSSAQAAVTSCSSSTVMSGSSLGAPGFAGTMCNGTTITNTSTDLPAFWSFIWGGTTGSVQITGTVQNFDNEILPSLVLYEAPENQIDSQFMAPDLTNLNFFTLTATLNDTLTSGTTYIVSIETLTDPSVQIGFAQRSMTPPVPLPASLPMLGGALAMLGIAAGLRKARA